jgi:saccharopine dehydrogenase (NADP+, L-glutamate forming)
MFNATPALILENLLLDKWQLQPEDRDMILMQHEFEYELEGHKHQLISTLVYKGENAEDTAMAKLVGLPLGILVRLVMDKLVNETGVKIPVMGSVYKPVLEELKTFGVEFLETERVLEETPNH